MKIIITEEQAKRFSRETLDHGKYGKRIEELSHLYMSEMNKSICDLVCINVNTAESSTYMVLIISSQYLSSSFERSLTKYIRSFIPVDVWVMVNVNHDCKPGSINESVDKTDLKSISKFVSSLPRPEELIGNNKTGETSGDDFFWPIIELLDYKSDNDYRRVKNLFMDLYRFTGALTKEDIITFIKIMNFKVNVIDKLHGDKIDDVSDDSWGDLKADIISRGKDFYNRAVSDFDLVQKMANEMDYKESFYYGIPYKSEL